MSSTSTSVGTKPKRQPIFNHFDPVAFRLPNHHVTALVESIAKTDALDRSQQINDPDIEFAERCTILTESYHSAPYTFLERYHTYITAEQLPYFDMVDYHEDIAYDIRHLLEFARARLKNRRRDVRNRRFVAMQKMLNAPDCSYFDEAEVMARNPRLYEYYIGQYLTDAERRKCDRIVRCRECGENKDAAVANGKFSRVLLDGIARDHVSTLRRQQEQEGIGDDDVDDDDDVFEDGNEHADMNSQSNASEANTDDITDEEQYPQIPPSFQQHWGEFADDIRPTLATPGLATQAAAATDQPLATKQETTQKNTHLERDRKQKYINSKEKEVLRKRFFKVIYKNFVDGSDRDFDYTQVDDNNTYDDLKQRERDEEDAYFDAEDEKKHAPHCPLYDGPATSDDELEKYMREIRLSAV